MAEKQLIVAVEGTAAMGPFWQTVVSDYLEKIIRCFCGNELAGQCVKSNKVGNGMMGALSGDYSNSNWAIVTEAGQGERSCKRAVGSSKVNAGSSKLKSHLSSCKYPLEDMVQEDTYMKISVICVVAFKDHSLAWPLDSLQRLRPLSDKGVRTWARRCKSMGGVSHVIGGYEVSQVPPPSVQQPLSGNWNLLEWIFPQIECSLLVPPIHVLLSQSSEKTSTSNVELSLVTFNAHGSYCVLSRGLYVLQYALSIACLVQRSGWTKDVDIFLQWLSSIPFAGGGFNDAAIAEGLSEALMLSMCMCLSSIFYLFNDSFTQMFSNAPNGSQNQQIVDGQMHCILVAASNPHPLPTPVYRPQMQNLEQSENVVAQTESDLLLLFCCSVLFLYLSYVQNSFQKLEQSTMRLGLLLMHQFLMQGKRNPRAADPPVDNGKSPQFLILISENFMEARAALSRSGVASLPSNQNPVKMDIAPVASVTGPAQTSIPSVNGSMMNRQPISVANFSPATVKVEPSTVASMGTGPAYPHIPSVPRPASQGVPSLQTSSPSSTSQEMITNSDSVPESKPLVSGISQPLRPGPPSAANVSILNNLSQVRGMNSAALTGGTSIGLQSMGQNPMAMHMSNMISSGMVSSVPAAQTVFSSAQSGITSVTGSGTLTGTAQVPQNSGPNSLNSATSNMPGNSNLGISQATMQGGVSMGQSIPGMSQGNHSGAQMVQSGIGMNQNMMNGLGPSGVSSGPGTMMPTPGMSQQAQSGMQQLGVNSNSAVNMPLSQQTSSALQSSQSKYVKVWEGNLSGQRQGQPVFITKLEGYRSSSASETLAANWPPTMQIVRLISQDHMNNKQYVGKADFLVFRAMNQHGFLGQLQDKKLCAVIQLPSQTLLLSVSDKACRLIGMLFPGVS
ncbi:hypothetical protein JRO89_XS05G0010000 [Xanthoceras sorbifolium]|uniref:Mediator of RNA polymerase II transcription subunit 25 n=1 Tax=Xanthoceras sorbifolium TaxID=99658 RepID=A0ABQ8HZT9_9ROSI|nr:hypothetical protein JRO89_XS05G0010000 [Xanthoceras sorbifolium]